MENYWDKIELTALLIDAGLVILIWMVQLIVYPSFLFFNKDNLFLWHKKYTHSIAIIVIPLMTSQLAFAFLALFYKSVFFSIPYFSIILFLSVFTFWSFAPLHFKISKEKITHNTLQLLVNRNWLRTFLWSLLFIFHLFFFQ